MWKQRGSATLMALTAMLILVVGAASVAYVSTDNINIMGNYADRLEAQYAAEAALKLVNEAGKAAMTAKPLNNQTAADADYDIKLPGVDYNARVRITPNPTTHNYDVRAVVEKNRWVNRVAYVKDMVFNLITQGSNNRNTAKDLSDNAKSTWVSNGTAVWTPESATSTVMLSPGYNNNGNNGWKNMASAILFNDSLGLANFSVTNKLQLVFRVNYYITLDKVPNSGGAGYGVYYLTPHFQPRAADDSSPWTTPDHANSSFTTTLNSAGDPTSYVVQYDPGLNPDLSIGNAAWGAVVNSNDTKREQWPYGAFLVKKAWWDGVSGWQNEVWDEAGGYNVHYAFQDNNELKQGYYDTTQTPIRLMIDTNLQSTNKALRKRVITWGSHTEITSFETPKSEPPVIIRIPTVFGLRADGTFGPVMTGTYHDRPPDLQLAYTLGDIAEGNPWQANTYYPQGAKVAVGVWTDDPLNNRLVWVATNGGNSGATKPSQLSSLPQAGKQVNDGVVVWEARQARTPEEVANYVCANGISIAKISMADLKFRIDSVNGTATRSEPYGIPFAMVEGNKNKITVELWIDNQDNRIHLIRVNDVLALAFNDRYDYSTYTYKKYNILPDNWVPGGSPTYGTGLRVWNAAVRFYTAENYGQTVTGSDCGIGEWGR